MRRAMRWLAAFCVLALFAGPAGALGEHEKVIYLTFDDGPKDSTPELVALLDELDVPATFFFIGVNVRVYPEYAKMVLDGGYAIGCHSMAHKYDALKQNGAYTVRDIERFNKTMRENVDETFETHLYRFPGGSTSYPRSIRQAVAQAGYTWVDWNGLTGDTMAGKTAEDIYKYALKTAGDDEVIVMLMHEGIIRTRRILPDLVSHYTELGYEFRALHTTEEELEILARCPANKMLAEKSE